MKNTGLGYQPSHTDSMRPYTVGELTESVKDLAHAQAVLKDKQNVLAAKRAAIKSFEEDEARAALEVERITREVKKRAATLEK